MKTVKGIKFSCVRVRDENRFVSYRIYINSYENFFVLSGYRRENDNSVFNLKSNVYNTVSSNYDSRFFDDSNILINAIRKFADKVYQDTGLSYNCEEVLLKKFFGKDYRQVTRITSIEDIEQYIKAELQ